MKKAEIFQTQSVFFKIKKAMGFLFSFFFREFNKNPFYQYRVFKIFLYTWVTINTLILFPGREYFWGRYSFVPKVLIENLGFFGKIKYLLFVPWMSDFYLIFIGLQIFFSLLAILNIWPRFSALVVFILTWNLDTKIHTTMDGGNNLIRLLLFYSVLIKPEKNLSKNFNFMPMFSVYLSKAAFVMARIQVALVYFVAGHMKLSGELWTKGTALYYTFNVEQFTHPWLKYLVTQFPSISVFGSYGTLVFQLVFPFFIWFSNLRAPLILCGIFLHLGIAFGMGLMSFGFAMIVSYSLFCTEKMAKDQYFSLSFKNSLLVGIDENCKICRKFEKFVSYFDWFRNITFDKARKPKNSLLLNIAEKERINRIYIYDYGQKVYFTGMKGIEVILKSTFLKPFYPFLAFLNILGLGEYLYEKFLVHGRLRKKCSEKDCFF